MSISESELIRRRFSGAEAPKITVSLPQRQRLRGVCAACALRVSRMALHLSP